MGAQGAAQVLRERIGHEATDALLTLMDDSSRAMGERITQAIGDRFERRLTEAISGVRVEMHKGFGEVRAEMHQHNGALQAEMHRGFAALRVEMHEGFGALRAEMYANTGALRVEMGALRADMHQAYGGLVRWSFVFWVGQLGMVLGLLAYLA